MKKSRLVFFLVFGGFHLFLVAFTFYVDSRSTDLTFLGNVLGLLPFLKYGALSGLMLLVADVVWTWMTNKNAASEKSALTHELNALKSKLFDLQEDAKRAQQMPETKP